MRGLSVFLFLAGLSFFANAAAGQWAFDFSKKETRYILLDIVLGVGCWLLSMWARGAAEERDLQASGVLSRVEDPTAAMYERLFPHASAALDNVDPPATEPTLAELHRHLSIRGVPSAWWNQVGSAISLCKAGEGVMPVLTGAGPCPARTVVAVLGLEMFVNLQIDWREPLFDEDAAPLAGRWFFPPNNDVSLDGKASTYPAVQEWLWPKNAGDDTRYLDGRHIP